jgi:hypothetical protein
MRWQGDTVKVTIDTATSLGRYQRVEYTVVANSTSSNTTVTAITIENHYDEGASELYGGGGEQVASGSGVTNAQGQLVMIFPPA